MLGQPGRAKIVQQHYDDHDQDGHDYDHPWREFYLRFIFIEISGQSPLSRGQAYFVIDHIFW